MKNKFSSAIILITSFAFYNKSNAQSANTSLSNLVAPTSVNVNLLPNQDNKRDLGSANKSWKNIYLDGSIYLGGARFLAYPAGTGNTAVGAVALNVNTNGFDNTAAGFNALFSNMAGSENTATGFHALYSNTAGNFVTANGSLALSSNTSGSDNTACGYAALSNNTTGFDNTACGSSGLDNNTTGNYNTSYGAFAGSHVTTGSNNTFIGYFANCGVNGILNNSAALGSNALVTSSNTVRVGDNSITSIGGYVGWSNISDGRVKKNIKTNVPGLTFINKLKPVTYNLNLDAADKIIQLPAIKDKAGKIIQLSAEELIARKEKEQIIYTGFIAQDVEKAAKELNYDFSGVDAAKNDHDLYGLRYAEFVVPLVKAVQELDESQKSEVKTQNEAITELFAGLLAERKDYEAKIDELQKQIDELKAMMASGNQLAESSGQAQTNNQHVTISAPLGVGASSLQQNIPNPFNNTTTINYTLPKQYLSAKIIVVDELGKTIKTINLSGAGKGSINFSSPFRVGAAYQYSLYLDGRLVQTRQMSVQQ